MKGAKSHSSKRRATIVRMSDVEPQDVDWLWHPFIPLGKVTLLEGDPGLGKTFLSLTFAAIITRGWPWPAEGGRPTDDGIPRAAVYMTAEDGLGDTLRPRLDAAGADPTLVHAITGWEEVVDGETVNGVVQLGDKSLLDQVLTEVKPALLVVDPLQAFLGASVDMHRANEVRPILQGLGQLAEKHGCAVIAIRHLAKGGTGRAVRSGLGSIDFAAAARSILLVGEHQGEKILAHTKSSLAPHGRSLRFGIRDGAIEWLGVSDVTPEQLTAAPPPPENSRARSEAAELLGDLLADGPVPVKELKDAARDAGVAWRTLERAKADLDVVAEKQRDEHGKVKGWAWRLTATKHTFGGLADWTEPKRTNGVLDAISPDRHQTANPDRQPRPPTPPDRQGVGGVDSIVPDDETHPDRQTAKVLRGTETPPHIKGGGIGEA